MTDMTLDFVTSLVRTRRKITLTFFETIYVFLYITLEKHLSYLSCDMVDRTDREFICQWKNGPRENVRDDRPSPRTTQTDGLGGKMTPNQKKVHLT